MRDDRPYIHYILDCIDRVQSYCKSGERAFFAETLIQDAVLRNLQTLAESTQRISDRLKASHPEIDWRAISGFRNVLVHDYLGLNLVRFWEIVSVHLPLLRSQLEAIQSEMGSRD